MSGRTRSKADHLSAAPTPQNTPASNAPILTHAQHPGVASIAEEEIDSATAASILAGNPKLVSMIQGRLGSLVGRPSGYIESLPEVVRRRIAGLKGIQTEHSKLEIQMQEDFLQLEKKYFQKFTPLYEKRAKIVNGSSEPSEDEIQVGQEAQQSLRLDGASETTTATGASGGNSSTNTSKGIPEFWLSAMKNQVSLAEMITDRDEVALKYLEDINMEYLDRPGFQLNFDFADNEYFSNRRLSKTYYYQEQTGYGGDFIYDHAVGTPVNWKPGRDLTVKIESKKQRNKNTKQTRVIRKSVPTESFFTFFSPPVPPDKEKYEDGDIEQRLELDYQLGEDIKEKLIPRAIDWFTGEALQYEQPDEEYDENDSEEEGSEDTDDLSDDGEETEESDGPTTKNQRKPEITECNQN